MISPFGGGVGGGADKKVRKFFGKCATRACERGPRRLSASPQRAERTEKHKATTRSARAEYHLFWKQVRTWYNRDTRIEPNGSDETSEWACRRHAHSLCPFSSTPFSSSPTATATTFPPRRRFDMRSDCDRVFALIQKEFLVHYICNQPNRKPISMAVFGQSRLPRLVAPLAAI
jgi:hypothetical protein